MRKFFAPLVLSLFFFIPFKVNASTYTINLDVSKFSIFESPGFAEFYQSIVSDGSNFVIKEQAGGRFYYRTGSVLGNSYSCSYKSGNILCINSSSGNTVWYEFTFPPFNNAGSTSTSKSCFNSSVAMVIATNIPLVPDNNIYIYKIGTDTLTCNGTDGSCNSLPTLLDLYKLSHDDPTIINPPEPEDSTPLLTTFYSIVIEKIGYVCSFFTSNYLYLSVFVIFLFYISILLLRRFIK